MDDGLRRPVFESALLRYEQNLPAAVETFEVVVLRQTKASS